MQVKIKTFIVSIIVTAVLFTGATIGCGYIYIQKSMAKFDQLNIRHNINKLEAQKRIDELSSTNRQLKINFNRIRQFNIAIQNANKKSIEYSNEIDKRCRELQTIIRKVNGTQ